MVCLCRNYLLVLVCCLSTCNRISITVFISPFNSVNGMTFGHGFKEEQGKYKIMIIKIQMNLMAHHRLKRPRSTKHSQLPFDLINFISICTESYRIGNFRFSLWRWAVQSI